jgi:hypothetical protein
MIIVGSRKIKSRRLRREPLDSWHRGQPLSALFRTSLRVKDQSQVGERKNSRPHLALIALTLHSPNRGL